ncbi:MAG: ABC transporter permease [Pseudochelatococcus sp.]|jgi:peptide/nickel transport system permease protein|uniref:ABC transporter permease n=1 Tax=Pseudochelatococcus sp. TaxID=2020869 RepID=UPI003D92CC42
MILIATIVRRIVLMIATLIAVAVLTFFIVNVLPGDVAYAVLGDQALPSQIEALQRELGLHLPLHERFAAWFGNLLRGDFGTSLAYNRPVAPMLLDRLGNSAVLALVSLSIIIPFAMMLGIAAAVFRNSLLDRAITTATTFLFAVPEYVLALMAILIFSIWLPWFPGAAMIEPGADILARWPVLILPVGVIVLGSSAYLAQITRASMIATLNAPYIRTARLKGMGPLTVIFRHALPNALLPTLVEIGLYFGALLGGLVIIETIFVYAGIGQLMVLSVQTRDVPVLQASVLVIATAYCIGSLIADVLSLLVNPRLRAPH